MKFNAVYFDVVTVLSRNSALRGLQRGDAAVRNATRFKQTEFQTQTQRSRGIASQKQPQAEVLSLHNSNICGKQRCNTPGVGVAATKAGQERCFSHRGTLQQGFDGHDLGVAVSTGF